MKINPYVINNILTWLPWRIIAVCRGFNNAVWNVCHYQYGKGPRIKNYTAWKAFYDGYRDNE